MIASILLVLDGQPAEHGSVNLGLNWAAEFNALLVGLGVIDEDVVHPQEAVPLGAGQAKRELDAARLHEQQVRVGAELSAIALRCAQSQVAFKPLEAVGAPAEEIAVEAQRFDVIIVPRTLDDQSAAAPRGISDSMRDILRATPRPVVAVSETTGAGNSVLVAYDGSLQAARTLHAFVTSGIAATRSVHVICINEDPIEAARRGSRAVEYLASHAVGASLHAVASEEPAHEITQLAAKLGVGLVVMGAYGKPRVREFFLGSVTTTLMRECPLPLFLYH